jgi:hypothetical protein
MRQRIRDTIEALVKEELDTGRSGPRNPRVSASSVMAIVMARVSGP